MDLFTLINVVLSRWRVVVPIAVLTLGVAYLVQTTAAREYEANGYLVLDAPEATGDRSSSMDIDLDGLAQGIELEGDGDGRNFTVTALGGANYAVAAAAPSAERAELDATAVVDGLAERVRAIQEDEAVPETGRLDVRLVDPQIIAEEQADGSFLATASVFLNDPAAAGENPYPPSSYTGRLLQVGVMGDSGLARFGALTGNDVQLVVGQEARDAAPLIQVLTTGPDPQRVIDGFFHARDIMVEDLAARQDRAGLLPRQRTTISVLDAPLGVTDESPPVERATAAVVALGGLLALGLALGLEGLDRRGGLASFRHLLDPDHYSNVGGPHARPSSTGVVDHGHRRDPPVPDRSFTAGGPAGTARPDLGDRMRQALAEPGELAQDDSRATNGSGRAPADDGGVPVAAARAPSTRSSVDTVVEHGER